MSDKTVQDLLDKSIKQDVAKQQQNKIQKLQEKVKDIEQNESVQISDMDKKYLKDLKHQWNELLNETVKVKTQYELLIQDVKLMKEITLAINKGDTWKYKLARWLVR
ncbi:MAG: hypothetical protein ACLUQX_12250 [Thomasclavelia spiroformis]